MKYIFLLYRAMPAHLFSFLMVLSFSEAASAIQEQSGDLLAELKKIDYGDKNENSWKEPDASMLASFRGVMDAFLAGDFITADDLASNLGYEVVEYRDTANKPVKLYFILRERYPLPSLQFIGGGTYVMNPRGKQVAIQAPHPVSDLFTSTQAIETFLTSQSRLLFLAGTRRNNSTQLSACTNSNYRSSDASHFTNQYFYLAHTQASDFDLEMVFVQFHGFGTSNLYTLQNQCNSTNDKLVNLSEGVNYQSNPSSQTFMQLLNRNINDAGVIKACVYGNETSSLGATWTTTGRYTNDSPDPCLINATTSSERFIHVEQSYRVRSNYRHSMATYITDTIFEYFKKSRKEETTKTAN